MSENNKIECFRSRRRIAGATLFQRWMTRLLIAGAMASGAQALDAVPQVSLPPAGIHGFPQSSSAIDLAARGYAEEEFFLSGTAQAFVNVGALGNDGRWTAQPNPGVTAPYITRIIVRRPQKAAHFNGTVLVEWMNVSGGRDLTVDWYMTYPELLREGYAYVGVSAQYVGAAFLKSWESGPNARYNAITHPGDSFSYDIFSQVARALKTPGAGGPKPLGNLTGKTHALLAIGNSQSATRLVTYANAIQPLTHLYDGILPHSIGTGAALSQSSAGGLPGGAIPAPPGVPATPDIPVPPTAFVRSDSQVPVLFLNTETELVALGAAYSVHKQPDSQMFRMWEVTGASHADRALLAASAPDAVKSGYPGSTNCGQPSINDGPNRYVARAALHALNKWAQSGVPAPQAPRIVVDYSAPPAAPAKIRRDVATGLALGGIRLPQIAVPTSTQTGERPPAALAASPFCIVFGASDNWNGESDGWDGQAGFDPSPTPEPTLGSLYRNHGDYVVKVVRATARSVLQGFLRPADGSEILKSAATAPVPD